MPALFANIINTATQAAYDTAHNIYESCARAHRDALALVRMAIMKDRHLYKLRRQHDAILDLQKECETLTSSQIEDRVQNGNFFSFTQKFWLPAAFTIELSDSHSQAETVDYTKMAKEYLSAMRFLPHRHDVQKMHEIFDKAMKDILHMHVTELKQDDSDMFNNMHVLIDVLYDRYEIINSMVSQKQRSYVYLNEILQLLFTIHLSIIKDIGQQVGTQNPALSWWCARIRIYDVYSAYQQHMLQLRSLFQKDDKVLQICEQSIRILQEKLYDYTMEDCGILCAMQVFLTTSAQLELHYMLHHEFNKQACAYMVSIIQYERTHSAKGRHSHIIHPLLGARITRAIQIYCMHEMLKLYNTYIMHSIQERDYNSTLDTQIVLLDMLDQSVTLAFGISSYLITHLKAGAVIYVINNLNAERTNVQEALVKLEQDTTARRAIVTGTLNALHNNIGTIVYNAMIGRESYKLTIFKIAKSLFNDKEHDIKTYLSSHLHNLLIQASNDTYIKLNMTMLISMVAAAYNSTHSGAQGVRSAPKFDFKEGVSVMRVLENNANIMQMTDIIHQHCPSAMETYWLQDVENDLKINKYIEVFETMKISSKRITVHNVHLFHTSTEIMANISNVSLLSAYKSAAIYTARGVMCTAALLCMHSIYSYLTMQ